MLARQATYHAYQTVPTGVEFKGVQKQGDPGISCPPTLQEGSFVASMVFQLTTLILGAIALAKGDSVPEVLRIVLVLELVVQCIEFVWYLVVGANYYFRRGSISIGYRYADWVFTTPVMLISIMLFALWDADKDCMTGDKVFGDSSRVAALVCMILADWLMLAIGVSYETKIEWATKLLDRIAMCFSGLWLGFIPFIGAFTPLFTIAATTFSGWGLASILLTFGTWLLYGVVAIMGNIQYLGEESRNSAYNILDIFSKNAVGLVVSGVAIGNDYNTTIPETCT